MVGTHQCEVDYLVELDSLQASTGIGDTVTGAIIRHHRARWVVFAEQTGYLGLLNWNVLLLKTHQYSIFDLTGKSF